MIASLLSSTGWPWSMREPPVLLVLCIMGKGGSGKSTTTVSLALAALALGLKVCVVDLDPQASLMHWRRLRGTSDIPVIACEPDKLADAIKTARRNGFDLLLIDTAPKLGMGLRQAMEQADFCLVVTRPAPFDLQVTQKHIELATATGKLFGVTINGALALRERREASFVAASREALRGLSTRLWDHQITNLQAIPLALARGRGVAETHPAGPSAKEYRALLGAILRDIRTNTEKSHEA